jgi:hypothetical protein
MLLGRAMRMRRLDRASLPQATLARRISDHALWRLVGDPRLVSARVDITFA